MGFKESLAQLRTETEKRKFEQTADIVVNLKGLDLRRDNIAFVVDLPHKVKEKRVCGFLTEKSKLLDTVTKPEFEKYKDKDKLRPLVKNYDFFIAHASLMPSVASTFGKALGPLGKMPSPQLGVITKETPEVITALLTKIATSVKVRVKEASVKVAVGKEKMSDEQIIANAEKVYDAVVNALPNKKENVKNVKIKFTMSKAVEVKL